MQVMHRFYHICGITIKYTFHAVDTNRAQKVHIRYENVRQMSVL